jgi:hypothetical protein
MEKIVYIWKTKGFVAYERLGELCKREKGEKLIFFNLCVLYSS